MRAIKTSEVIHCWVPLVQGAIAPDVRDSSRWRDLLDRANKSTRTLERERSGVALRWMWTRVVSQVQPFANANGYGSEWTTMRKAKTIPSIMAAARAVQASHPETAVVDAPDQVLAIARVVRNVAFAITAFASRKYALAALDTATCALAARVVSPSGFWYTANPCRCLEQMLDPPAAQEPHA
jgi:hypothetical protein